MATPWQYALGVELTTKIIIVAPPGVGKSRVIVCAAHTKQLEDPYIVLPNLYVLNRDKKFYETISSNLITIEEFVSSHIGKLNTYIFDEIDQLIFDKSLTIKQLCIVADMDICGVTATASFECGMATIEDKFLDKLGFKVKKYFEGHKKNEYVNALPEQSVEYNKSPKIFIRDSNITHTLKDFA